MKLTDLHQSKKWKSLTWWSKMNCVWKNDSFLWPRTKNILYFIQKDHGKQKQKYAHINCVKQQNLNSNIVNQGLELKNKIWKDQLIFTSKTYKITTKIANKFILYLNGNRRKYESISMCSFREKYDIKTNKKNSYISQYHQS